jgi:hypothetical protein
LVRECVGRCPLRTVERVRTKGFGGFIVCATHGWGVNSAYNMLPMDATLDCPNCDAKIERSELTTKGLGEIYCENCK